MFVSTYSKILKNTSLFFTRFISLVLFVLSLDSASLAADLHRHKFDQFAPSSPEQIYQIDYTEIDLFLSSIVVNFGPSERQVPYGLGKITGSRVRYGHHGKTALEGNRILFSLFTAENRDRLTYLRQYLETLSEIVDFEKLTKDQQLAFWLNLYNITMIEQIALKYPVIYPERIQIGPQKEPLLDAKITRIDGIPLSLNDIQKKIVYTGWNDPSIIYGFFTGVAGGPNIRPFAYTGQNVWQQLEANAKEFINSLRGVRLENKSILVSQLYGDSISFFANNHIDLRNHLLQFSDTEVAEILQSKRPISIGTYYNRIADLSGGSYMITATMNSVTSISISQDLPISPLHTGRKLPPHAQQLMVALHKKFLRLRKRGITPTVTVSEDRFLEDGEEAYSDNPKVENQPSVEPATANGVE